MFGFNAKSLAAIAASAFAAGAVHAVAADITYAVNETILNGGVTGTITTDGATGTLSQSDIVSWNLLLQGGGATYTLTNGNSAVFNYGTSGFFGPQSVDLTATAHDLYFNYSGPDAGYFGFQANGLYSGNNYWCNATHNQGFDCAVGESVVPNVYNASTSQYNTAKVGNDVIGVATGGVPEPASWLIMLAGFGGLGGAFRAGRRLATAAV